MKKFGIMEFENKERVQEQSQIMDKITNRIFNEKLTSIGVYDRRKGEVSFKPFETQRFWMKGVSVSTSAYPKNGMIFRRINFKEDTSPNPSKITIDLDKIYRAYLELKPLGRKAKLLQEHDMKKCQIAYKQLKSQPNLDQIYTFGYVKVNKHATYDLWLNGLTLTEVIAVANAIKNKQRPKEAE